MSKSIGQIAFEAAHWRGELPPEWRFEAPDEQILWLDGAAGLLVYAAQQLRAQGEKAKTYDQQAQWNAAADFLERME